MDRRLAAIMAADVVGYSRLVGEDEAGTLTRLRAHRKELIEPKIGEHKGRIVKLMGDGLLAEFPSAVEAVQCAVALQHIMGERNASVPEGRRLVFRVGINIGDIVVEDDDIYGDGVNVAARLEALADPGGICISRTVYSHVKGKLDLTFESLGERHVKNIAEPVTVYRVVLDNLAAALATPVLRGPKRKPFGRWPSVAAASMAALLAVIGLIWWQPWVPEVAPISPARMAYPLPDKPSIAVLPFANMSDDPQQEYFADGMTEDLITDLAKISGLFVIARNTSFAYKNKSIDVKQVARQLGVRYILEGSVRRSGDQVRINAQLIDATSGGHLWAERFDERIDNVFVLQDQVAREIIAALKIKLTFADRENLDHNPRPVNLEAYEWLLKGRKELAAQDRKSADLAKLYFERSIAADPNYARAYTNLGFYFWQEWRIWGRDMAGNLAKAKEIGRQAVALDDLSAGARVLLAVAHQTDGEHQEADKWGSEALHLNPTQAETLGNLGAYLLHAGRHEDAIEIFTKAVRLDPLHPPQWLSWLGHAYFLAGQPQKSSEVLQAGIAREPNYVAFHVFLAACYADMAEPEKAQAAAREVLRLNSGFTATAYERYAMGNSKNAGDVRRVAAALIKAGLPK